MTTEVTETLWSAGAGQSLIAPPIVFGETLLLASQPAGKQGHITSLQAFDLADGSQRWQHDFEYAAVSGMQAYYLAPREQDIAVVTASSSDFLRGEGSLLAFDQQGEVIWQAADGEDRYSAPVVMDRMVYVLAGSNKLLIVSPEQEGDSETRIPLDASVASAAPLVMDGMAYIPCRKPELLAVELSGNVCWRFKYQTNARDWLDMTPAASAERLFVVSSAGSVFALERESGELMWRLETGGNWGLTAPVVDGERLYVGFKRGLRALDSNNGRILWTLDSERPIVAAPLIVHDTLYVAGHDHFLYALDKVTGELRWSHSMARRIEMPPVLAPAALLIVDRGGQINALERPPEPEPELVVEPELDPAALRAMAEEHERSGNHLQAAELWCQVGELDRAAKQYEAGEAWLDAAETWQKLYRYNRRAEAYEQHAQAVSKQDVGDEEKAAAWEQAVHAYRETTLRENRHRAETEVARYRKQPILELEVKHDDLMVETWSSIEYTILNKGFGPARLMGVYVKPDRFETESTMSVVQPVIHSDSPPYKRSLQLRPLQKGDGVPMKFVVEYRDNRNQDHRFDRTFNVPVFSESDTTTDFGITGVRLSAAERKRYFALARTISDRFSMEELEELLFGLGINPDNLEGITLAAKSRELVRYCLRRDSIDELIDTGESLRQDIDWDSFR